MRFLNPPWATVAPSGPIQEKPFKAPADSPEMALAA